MKPLIHLSAKYVGLVAIAAIVVTGASPPSAAAQTGSRQQQPFELNDGDRVVLIGNTFIERAQRYGYIELALTTRWPDRQIIFRNLGWSGDDVTGESRVYFGSYRNTTVRQEGLDRLLGNVNMIEPTVIMVGYGSNAAFNGKAGLEAFSRDYSHLLDELGKTGARVVLISPIAQESLGAPLPDPAERNRDLEFYAEAIRNLAAKRNHRFVDLFHGLDEIRKQIGPLTDNGMHLTAPGYYYCALALQKGLGLDVPELAALESGEEAGRGIQLSAEAEELRQLILEKNQLFFRRYRPQNDTYLRGFREYEQGNNAVEIPQFDPLVEQKDREINERKLHMPQSLVYLLLGGQRVRR